MITMFYQGNLPENIRFGRGVRWQLTEFLSPGKTIFICGKHSVERIRKEAETLNIEARIATVSGELPLHELEALLALVRKLECRNFIGWGGGSAMDCAKALAALADSPGSAAECFYNRSALTGRNNRMILIPTTAGTGAEITSNSVICDHETGIKQSLRGCGMTADAALVDPELLQNMPQKVIAASGFDALTQALESFTSRKATVLTRQMALSAARLLLGALEAAFNGDDSALDDLARGSMLTGIAFASSGLGAVHGIAHPLGSLLNIPHGECCAVLLLPVLSFNAKREEQLFEHLAQGLGFAGVAALFERLRKLQCKLGIAADFRAYGLKREHYDFTVKNCRSGSMACNPVEFSDQDVITLLESLS